MSSNKLPFLSRSEIFFALCIVFFLISVGQVKAQDSEIEKIIGDVSVDTQRGAIFNYTYLMKFSYNRHRFGGRKFTRLYEAILPTRYSLKRFFGHPLILVEDSENPITDDQIRVRRMEAVKILEKAENEKDEDISNTEKPLEDGGYWTVGFSNNSQRLRIDVLQLLKSVKFSNLQRIEVNGRKVILIDFAPNPNAVLEKSIAYISKIEGRICIDETDKRVMTVEGYAVGEFAKLKELTDEERQKQAIFLFRQTKVAEGFWFPQVVRLNFAKNPNIFDPIEIEYAFSNYRKGNVEILYMDDTTKNTNETKTNTETPAKDQ